VVGVSRDRQERSDDFRRSLDLPYPLVGDADGSILRAYKVRWPVVGIARRVTYLVGRDRKVRSAFHSELDVEAHARQACALLRSTAVPTPAK
jgi:peroxiredoxin